MVPAGEGCNSLHSSQESPHVAPARRRQAERNLRLSNGHPLVAVAVFFFYLGTPPKSNIDTNNDGFFKGISFRIWRHFGYPC